MTATGIPIHLAIPVYNNTEGLQKLLDEAVKQNFSSITVLDDASTEPIQDVVAQYENVLYIRASHNGGPVAAKNLVLRRELEGVILFIDSDMQIITDDIPGRLAAFFYRNPNTGGGIGIIRDRNGGVLRFTRGYDLSPIRMVLAGVFYLLHTLLRRIPGIGALSKHITSLFTHDLDDEVAKKVDWVAEGFFFVRADILKRFGGFDRRFKRYHEGPDLCLQIRKAGYAIWFFPDIEVRDTDQATGSSWHRRVHWWRSLFIYYWKNPSRLFWYYYPHP